MAEEIKTILTADSSELVAEFAKVSAIAQKFASDRERQGALQLASAQAAVESLRLEALGQNSASAALREKTALVEKAIALSARTGINEQQALGIAEQELAYRKDIATQREKEAAAATRATRIAAPGKNGIALPELALTQANLIATEKAAARAGEACRKLNFGQGPSSGSAMGLLAVSAAVEDAQYGFKGVINNIPQAVMAFGNFTPAAMRLAGGLSLVAVAGYAVWKMGYALAADQSVVDWAETQTAALAAARKELDKYQAAIALRRARDATENRLNEEREKGNRLIELGLKLDQYRLKEIEKQAAATQRKRAAEDTLLSAASASGGFSGARITTATRNLEDTRSIEDAAAAQKLLNEYGTKYQDTWHQTSAIAETFAAKSRAASSEFEQATNTLGILKSKQVELEAYIKEKGASPKDQNRFKHELEDINKQIAAYEALIFSKKADMAANSDLAKASAAQSKSSLDQLSGLMDAQKDRLAQIPQEITLRTQLRALQDATNARASKDWNQELAIQQALARNDLDRAHTLQRQRDIEAEKRSLMAEQKNLTDAQAAAKATGIVATRADAQAAAAKKSAADELEILRARAAGQNDRAGQLRTAANLEREILSLMQAQNLTRAQATAQARENADLQHQGARVDLMAEITALRMEASGNKAAAAALREEMALRKQAQDLAQASGINETSALSALREQARLKKQISDQKKSHGRHAHSYTKSGNGHEGYGRPVGTPGDGLTMGGLSIFGLHDGLRPHEISRRNTERQNRPRNPSDDASHTLLKSMNIQQEMLKLWQKLNVV